MLLIYSTWILLLLSVGTASAQCPRLSDPQCSKLHTLSIENGADHKKHCLYTSMKIACYETGPQTTSCDTLIKSQKTYYFITCFINSTDISNCKVAVTVCSSFLKAAQANANQLGLYCSHMKQFEDCLETQMANISSCKSEWVTKYDIAGGVLLARDKICNGSSADTTKVTDCQAKINQAGCNNNLQNAYTAISSSNYPEYCRHMKSFFDCFNSAYQQCDQSVSKTEVGYGNRQTYDSVCNLPPKTVCNQTIYAACSDALQKATNSSGNPTTYCSEMKVFMDCANTQMTSKCNASLTRKDVLGGLEDSYQMLCSNTVVGASQCRNKVQQACYGSMPKVSPNQNVTVYCSGLKSHITCMDNQIKMSCDASVNKSDVLGLFKMDFDASCNAGGLGYCPLISECFKPMAQAEGSGNPNTTYPTMENIVNNCSLYANLMNCFDLKFKSCKLTNPRTYTFGEVSLVMQKGCQALAAKKGLTGCPAFNTCLSTQKLPSSSNLQRLMYNPEYWCSMARSALTCSVQCYPNDAALITARNDGDQLCPKAQLYVSVPVGGGNVNRASVGHFLLAFLLTTVMIRNL